MAAVPREIFAASEGLSTIITPTHTTWLREAITEGAASKNLWDITPEPFGLIPGIKKRMQVWPY
jgi:hypothetical protein